jgi:integrase
VTVVRVKGFQIFRDRHGKLRCYHRRTRQKIDLEKSPIGSAEFLAECGRLSTLAQPVPTSRPVTLGALIKAYRGSKAFTDLAPRTIADYQRMFDYLAPIADTALSRFDAPLIAGIRDKAHETRGRRQAVYVKQVLSILFGWGTERGHMASNPATLVKGIKRPKDTVDANRPWSDEERHAVLEAAPAHLATIIALMMFTGIGPKDAVRLQRSAYRDGEIASRRSKTGEPIFWPAPVELRRYLDAAPPHNALTLCVTSRGRPWSQDGLQSVWQRLKHRLERDARIAPGLTLYGLRHSVAVMLREIGYDERTIADALGQATIEMARIYAKGADLRPKMRGVVQSLDAELNKRRTKIVKPSG